jgi:hypothetical protein
MESLQVARMEPRKLEKNRPTLKKFEKVARTAKKCERIQTIETNRNQGNPTMKNSTAQNLAIYNALRAIGYGPARAWAKAFK